MTLDRITRSKIMPAEASQWPVANCPGPDIAIAHTPGGFMKLMSVLFLIFFVAGCGQGSGGAPSAEMAAPDKPAAVPLKPLEKGKWGSEQIGLAVSDSGASFDLQCGRGKIKEKIVPDENGNFEAKGTVTQFLYGIDETNRTFDAEFFGDVSGDTMELTVMWENEDGVINREKFSMKKDATGPASQCID